MDFYLASVEVIVVLLLLTAIEARYFRLVRRMGFFWNFAQVAAFFAVINGLIQALRSLQHQRPSRLLGYGASWWVWWAIIIEVCIVVAIALRGGRDFEAIQPNPPTRLGIYLRERRTFISMQAVALVLLVLLFAAQGTWGAYTLLATAPVFVAYIFFAAWVTRGGPTSPGRWPGWMSQLSRAVREDVDKNLLR